MVEIIWSDPVIAPTKSGTLYLLTGYIIGSHHASYNDGEITLQARRELTKLAGLRRGAWGKVEYRYARIRMATSDVMLVSCAVEVNEPTKGQTR